MRLPNNRQHRLTIIQEADRYRRDVGAEDGSAYLHDGQAYRWTVGEPDERDARQSLPGAYAVGEDLVYEARGGDGEMGALCWAVIGQVAAWRMVEPEKRIA